jgi:hypothetical protein
MLVQELLLEHLGNLSKLKAGKLLNIFKQGGHGFNAGEVGNKFLRHLQIGTGSEIIDMGPLKDIADIRKGFRKHIGVGFAIYIAGKAVAVGRFNDYILAGSAREGLLAWDFSIIPSVKQSVEEKNLMDFISTFTYDPNKDLMSRRSDKETDYSAPYEYKPGVPRPKKTVHYEGVAATTVKLKEFITKVKEYAGSDPVTWKLITSDSVGNQKFRDRSEADQKNRDPFEGGIRALQERLVKYKISKKPTANSIEEFIKFVLGGKAGVVQFNGKGYALKKNTDMKIDGHSIIAGREFRLSYRSVTPGDYSSVYITFKFNPAKGTLSPVKAEWPSDKHYTTVSKTFEGKK